MDSPPACRTGGIKDRRAQSVKQAADILPLLLSGNRALASAT
jgi:hypothetical protein